jgi:hypothetical protein
MISGKLVISSMLAVGLSMALFAWWARYSQSQQVLETWGRDAVVAIRTGEQVELLRASSEDSDEGEALTIGDSTVRFDTSGDISETPGLIHARHHLVHQKGFDWTGAVEPDCQPQWDTGLRFKDTKRNKVSTMLFDFNCNRVHLLENQAEVTMRPTEYIMQKVVSLFLFVAALCCSPATLLAKGPEWTRPQKAEKQHPQFAVQGEYVGEVQADGEMKVGGQVIAMGGKKYAAQFYMGGLPGDGMEEKLPLVDAEARDDGSVLFEGDEADALLKDGVITVLYQGNEIGTLKKVKRKSKTLGKKPPKGAIVLFDGKNADHWNSAVLDRKFLAFDPKGRGATSKEKFGDHSIHIEFRLPYMPEARGQGRGNSGIYLQGRYEVQMLDSFGLAGMDNECGGIYKISKPKQNMCYPPLAWQTYDIDFTAAKYDSAGEVVQKPKMTVRHNGVLIHKDLELPKHTTAAPLKAGPEDGPVYLQNHGNPVRYRNVWVVKK